MAFDPAKDIPNLSGKVIFITGGTNGIGRQAILDLAEHSPSEIFFTGRSAARATALTDSLSSKYPETKFVFIECNQQSLNSVANAAKLFYSRAGHLDILICNAGVMATSAFLTDDGYENQFGVNHLSHALFVKLLLPSLLKGSKDPRIVFITSLGFMYSFPNGGILFDSLKSTQDFGPGCQWARYGQSKLANVLYAAELARQNSEILSVSVHPGTVATDLIGRLGEEEKAMVYASNDKIMEVYEGAYNTCWAATSARANIVNGEVYVPVGERGEHTKESSDRELGERLWEWTQEELKEYK